MNTFTRLFGISVVLCALLALGALVGEKLRRLVGSGDQSS